MKPFFTATLLLFITTLAQAQWEVQLDNENLTHLDRIFFLDENLGWAIGGATIGGASPYFYTQDGGTHWYLTPDWMNRMGTDICFVNPDTGFIAAANGIVKKTSNGGQTWNDIQTPATQSVMRLFFVDEMNGWATLENSGNLLHSIDGGNTWEVKTTNLSYISDIFIIENTIWCSGWSYSKTVTSAIIKSNDNGVTWAEKYTNSNIFFLSLHFANNSVGWASGQEDTGSYLPVIFRTSNSGENWDEQTLNNSHEYEIANIVYFENDTTGWIGIGGGIYGAIYFTNDGGQNWKLQQEFNKGIYDFYMLNKDTAWAVGADYIYHTSNGDTIIVAGVDKNIQEKDFLKINPNPFMDNIKLSVPKEYQLINMVIMDITGKVCFETNKNITDQINLSFLQKGIYFLTINFKTNNQINFLTQKIIKYS